MPHSECQDKDQERATRLKVAVVGKRTVTALGGGWFNQEEDAQSVTLAWHLQTWGLSHLDACRQMLPPFGRLCGRRCTVIKIF